MWGRFGPPAFPSEKDAFVAAMGEGGSLAVIGVGLGCVDLASDSTTAAAELAAATAAKPSGSTAKGFLPAGERSKT